MSLFEAPKTLELPAIDPNKDYLPELVGDEQKFKTVQDLARAKLEADHFIERLKAENAGMRQEMTTRLSLEQLMDKIKEPATNGTTPSGNRTTEEQNNQNAQKGPELTPDKIAELVNSEVEKRDRKRQQEQNVAAVQQELQKAFGPDYATRLKGQAQALGLGEEFLNGLAREQPRAFLKLMIPEKSTEAQRTESSSLFSPPTGEGFKPSTSVRNYKYYEEIRKKNPTEYFSVTVQNQIHADAMRLQEKFYE